MKAKVNLNPAPAPVLPRWAGPMEAALFYGIDCRPMGTVADLTPRDGATLAEICARFRPGSAQALAIPGTDKAGVSAHFREAGIKAPALKAPTRTGLPFAASSLDLIIGLYGLEGAHGAVDLLTHAAKALRPGGQLVLAAVTDEVFLEIREAFAKEAKHLAAAGDLFWQERHPSPLLWKPALAHHGLEVQGLHHGRVDFHFSRVEHLWAHPGLAPFLNPWLDTIPLKEKKALLAKVQARLEDLKVVHDGIRLRIPFVVVRGRKPVAKEKPLPPRIRNLTKHVRLRVRSEIT